MSAWQDVWPMRARSGVIGAFRRGATDDSVAALGVDRVATVFEIFFDLAPFEAWLAHSATCSLEFLFKVLGDFSGEGFRIILGLGHAPTLGPSSGTGGRQPQRYFPRKRFAPGDHVFYFLGASRR